MLAKLPHVVAIPNQADEAYARSQQIRDAQCHVAASHEQHALHHDA
jgi:hypothetical protein